MPGMRANRAPDDDPLDQDAADQYADDPAIEQWFIDEKERRNPATDLRLFSIGNLVVPLIDGAEYFPRLRTELGATVRGDAVYFLDFRGDFDERLGGPGTEIGETLTAAARRGVQVFGLLWRSQPGWLGQSEETNADFAREIEANGGHVLLDARTRRAGSHHQKLVVIRHRATPECDVAFVGGIDLGHSRHDDARHLGDPQPMDFPKVYGPTPPWHDLHAEVRGPAVHDLEHTFRERWYGSSALDLPSPLRQLYDRTYHAGAMTGRPLPEPVEDDTTMVGPHAVQVLRTYPARLRRYPFAPLGERSIAHAYRRVFGLARQLIYLEDQYLWSRDVGRVIAAALHSKPDLHVIVVVPRFADQEGLRDRPSLIGHRDALRMCERAGAGRFAAYDLENAEGAPVYVHSKVVVVDDVWAMVGSDNLNRRSWTHDSELSIAVLDSTPAGTAGRIGSGSDAYPREFARGLRLRLWREHLGRDADDTHDLIKPKEAFDAFAAEAAELHQWYAHGSQGARPRGRILPHAPVGAPGASRLWARPAYRFFYDPDGRPVRDRLRRRA